MTDFLSRLVERTMAREPAVAPVISPMYAQERHGLHQEMSSQVITSEDDHPPIADIPPIGASRHTSYSHRSSATIDPQQLVVETQVSIKTDPILSQEEHLSTSQVNLPVQSPQRNKLSADKQSASDQQGESVLPPSIYRSIVSEQKDPQLMRSLQTIPGDQQGESAPPPSIYRSIVSEQKESQLVRRSQAIPSVQQQNVPLEDPLTTYFTPLLEDTVLHELSKPVITGTLARTSSVEGQNHQTHSQSVSQLPSSEEAPSPAPTIQVTIGRIEVRATQPPAVPRTQSSQQAVKPSMSLDQYLQQRGREGHS